MKRIYIALFATSLLLAIGSCRKGGFFEVDDSIIDPNAVSVDAVLAAGSYNYTFDSGTLPAGVYYARLQNGATQQVKAMVKVR